MSKIDDTIVAVSSPPGPGAEAVVRMSGERSFEIAERIFKPAGKRNVPSGTFTVVKGAVSLPRAGIRVPALMYAMRAPATYTREDIVELHLPCSPPLLDALLDEAVRMGARPAGPGEFTRRACLNGRIDLNQAEAVLDIITAAGRADHRQAFMQLRGFAAGHIEALRRQLLEVISLVELSIDFSDEDIEVAPQAELRRRLQDAQSGIAEILRRGRRLVPRQGVATVLYGPANAGKSTLFNALVGKEHAIVSHIPGTTRDYLEAVLDVEGFRFRLIDTAGLKEARDVVETLALSRTREYAEAATIRLLVLDAVDCLNDSAGHFPEAAMRINAVPQAVVLNKMDAVPDGAGTRAELCARARAAFPGSAVVPASALKREGLETLEGELVRQVTRTEDEQADFLPNLRQRHALEGAAVCLAGALGAFSEDLGEEIAAFELRGAADALAAVTGRIAPEEVMDEIFGRFCIGK
ncbi:MAG: tRNA uridine-5-carboxymethylaminomethyl(34) synthesis GTPase MnmE [Planctomycetota bacterium]